MRLLTLLLALIAAPAAAQTVVGGSVVGGDLGVPPAPSVLLVVCDDCGRDQLEVYGGESSLVVEMPALDSMASAGLKATAAYSSPICAPSRISLVYGLRNVDSEQFSGPVGAAFDYDHDGSLPAMVRAAGGVARAHGKPGPRFPGPPESSTYAGWSPLAMGWDSYRGLTNTHPTAGFKSWTRTEATRAQFLAVSGCPGSCDYAGDPPSSTGSVSTHIDDDNVGAAVTAYSARDRALPYLGWIGLYTVHSVTTAGPHTWHDPAAAAPANTCALGSDELCREANLGKVDAMLASILAVREPSTYVIFVADGGSESGNGAGGKDTLAENGIRVPLLIVGPGVTPGSTLTTRVDVTDLHITVADLLGADYSGSDGIAGYSFAELIGTGCDLVDRCWEEAAEHDVVIGAGAPGDWAILSSAAPNYKLVTNTGDGDSALYDISAYTGTGAESGDLCGGDGDCTGIAGADATAYNALCARVAGHPNLGSGCPAL